MATQARIAAALAAAVAIAATSALASCFEAPEPSCAFACGDDRACPASYRCAPDGWCKRDDVADDYECGESLIDAAPSGELDADDEHDAEPDAEASRARDSAARAAAPRYNRWS